MANSSGISISGMGSGLDIQGIVGQLVQAEGASRTQLLDQKESKYETTLSSLSKLKSAASEFRSAAYALRNLDTFRTREASSSNEDILTASADPGAPLGSYNVEVLELAAAQKQASAGFADGDSTVGEGQLTFSSGAGSFSIDVAAGDSLNAIRDRINESADNDSVRASILNVDDGAGGTEARLVLTSTSTGEANAVNVTATDSDGNDTDNAGLSRLASTNLQELSAAKDAQLTVDGLSVTSASNEVDGVVEGVTFDLTKAEPGSTVTVDVGTDNSPVMDALKEFVEKYNGLNSTYRGEASYDEEAEEGGVLQGDSTANGLMRGLRSFLGGNAGNGDVRNMADIGIQIDSDGKMSLDEAKAEQALSEDAGAVKDFLAGNPDGMARQVDSMMKPYLEFDGFFDNRRESLNTSLDRISDQRDALNRRLDSYRDSLTQQFAAMDSMVSSMQQSASYLGRIGQGS